LLVVPQKVDQLLVDHPPGWCGQQAWLVRLFGVEAQRHEASVEGKDVDGPPLKIIER
jgi:hypothetical protein